MAKPFCELYIVLDALPGELAARRVVLRRRNLAASAPVSTREPAGRGLARLALALLAVAVTLALPSPPARAQEFALDDAAALIRFVHAVPAAPGLDFSVDGALLVQGLEFGTATDVFISVSAGAHTLEATSATGDVAYVVAAAGFDLAPGVAYEVAVVGLPSAASIAVYPIDSSATADGWARVRLIACVPDAAVVGLVGLGAQGPIEGVSFAGASAYVEVESGGYDLALLLAGQETTVELGEVAFDAGTISDLFVVGLLADGSASVLVVRTQPFDSPTP